MPRRQRPFEAGLSVHVIQRGNNRMQIFHQTIDYEFYLSVLRRAADQDDVAIHGFSLMSTHTHLILTPTPDNEHALERMMHRIGSRYAIYYNRAYQRIGRFWNAPYRAIWIDTEQYWLTCLRYIEQNPVRAGVVERPEDYRWSSYCMHAFGAGPAWMASHPCLDALGSTSERRQRAYRALFGNPLSREELALARSSLSVRAEVKTTQ